jgi:hypothetical protein
LYADIYLEEKWDESNIPPSDRSLFPFGLELRAERHFIQFFGPYSPLYSKGHTAKKDISVSKGIIFVRRGLWQNQGVGFKNLK